MSLKTSTNQQIRAAVEAADALALRATVALLTREGAPHLHAQLLQPVAIGPGPGVLMTKPVLTDAHQLSDVQDAAVTALCSIRDGQLEVPTGPFGDDLLQFAEMALGKSIPVAETEYWREELAIDSLPREVEWDRAPDAERLAESHAVVIGAGMGGIAAAVNLDQLGLPYTIIEKNADVGGTWFQNRYPGARVDIASRIYSYSFEADYPWTHHFAPAAEIRDYLRHTADKYGIRRNLRCRNEVVSARWDEAEKRWNLRIRAADGVEYDLTATAIISAVGMHDRPALPNIRGRERFEGPLFHTARWPAELALQGKRVAVIGTGASGLQLAAEIAPLVTTLCVFQRTPAWVLPIPGYRDAVSEAEQWLISNLPYYVNFRRLQTSSSFGDAALPVYDVDPEWRDPLSVNPFNHFILELLTEHMESKLGDPPRSAAKIAA